MQYKKLEQIDQETGSEYLKILKSTSKKTAIFRKWQQNASFTGTLSPTI